MKRVIALPKIVFEEKFNNKSFLDNQNACFISILDPDNMETKYDLKIGNFLQVRMWDIEKDIKSENGVLRFEKPKTEVLQKIVDFVNLHKDKNVFIVHCSAGISRSGAVARFIYEKFYLEVDREEFMRDSRRIMSNIHILKTLKELDDLV